MKIKGIERHTITKNAFETYIKQLNKLIEQDDGKNPKLIKSLKNELSETKRMLVELHESFDKTYNQVVSTKLSSVEDEKLE